MPLVWDVKGPESMSGEPKIELEANVCMEKLRAFYGILWHFVASAVAVVLLY